MVKFKKVFEFNEFKAFFGLDYVNSSKKIEM